MNQRKIVLPATRIPANRIPASAPQQADCDPCTVPGWNPGPAPSGRPNLRDRSSPLSMQYDDACDPRLGLANLYLPINEVANLSVVDPTAPAPPTLYTPIAEAATSSAQQWTVVWSILVPAGYNATHLKMVAGINALEWAAAVEFAVYVANQIAGDQWVGRIEWPSFRPLQRVAVPGQTVQLRARIREQYWTIGATPIRSLIVAESFGELMCQSDSAPC